MNTRPAFVSRPSAGRRFAPAPAPSSAPTLSPRSGTPTRFSSRNRQQRPMPPLDPSEPRTGASTPRRRNHSRKRGESRKAQPESPETPVASEPDTPDGDTEEDSEELFQLLGVNDDDSPAVEKGLLRLSKENMDVALGTKKKNRSRTKNKPRSDHPSLPADQDNGDSTRHQGTRDASPTPNASGGRRRRGKGDKQRDLSPDALDMAAMSRSLPASFFAEDQKSNTKWDMPTETSPKGELNWQQQLQAEHTPSKRNNRAAPSSRRKTPAAAAAAAPRSHDRHQSLDHVPVSNLSTMMASVGSASANGRAVAVPVSAFDASIPFHTGFNVHRAPQTPVRNITARSPAPGPPGAISLPIVGDFPRINKSGGPIGGPKYAGPTFHNSPASGSLPKPDLDDF